MHFAKSEDCVTAHTAPMRHSYEMIATYLQLNKHSSVEATATCDAALHR